uniref:Uncharacterized protein n=1 Tax=Nelumbo nucifera TaxID=4432 RepID=A0A822YT61_NELNU|nr:TPA_asm: hypothetical protein HUJ06_005933 [Nelumbo nucifera]
MSFFLFLKADNKFIQVLDFPKADFALSPQFLIDYQLEHWQSNKEKKREREATMFCTINYLHREINLYWCK